jgi:hypothetical protein
MWPPKRWEIESGHICISSWVQGERREEEEEEIPGFAIWAHCISNIYCGDRIVSFNVNFETIKFIIFEFEFLV